MKKRRNHKQERLSKKLASEHPRSSFDKQLLDFVTEQFLISGDFNGLPVAAIDRELDDGIDSIKKDIRLLVESGKVEIVYDDRHPNPHIRALPAIPIENQIAKMETPGFTNACLYPTPSVLTKVVDRSEYASQPYTLCRALGEPDLSFKAFDVSILEWYRNDPRYYYINDDVEGHIAISDTFYDKVRDHDQIMLQTFGFCYDKDDYRFVAVFTVYLSKLSAEHQIIWKAREMSGEYIIHPVYLEQSYGNFPDKIPLTAAFVEELHVINLMCAAMGRIGLFRNTFYENPPKKFSFLVRPTLAEFNEFVLLIDKMISDNIDKRFFRDDISLEIRNELDGGEVKIDQKGTLAALEEWIGYRYRPKDPVPLKQAFATFRRIRKLRQKPAHSIDEDVFDQKLFKDQRQLLLDSYIAIRTIRLLFANHSAVKSAKIPISTELRDGQIRTY
ncbi:AAA family ATPase [bacterium]|nr:AAA family ATPase [bacterium]